LERGALLRKLGPNRWCVEKEEAHAGACASRIQPN
jgi:hypothetical protein